MFCIVSPRCTSGAACLPGLNHSLPTQDGADTEEVEIIDTTRGYPKPKNGSAESTLSFGPGGRTHSGIILRDECFKPMGIPQSRLSENLAGRRSITVDTAARLGRLFRVDPGNWPNHTNSASEF